MFKYYLNTLQEKNC